MSKLVKVFQKRLAALPKTDRGIFWQLRNSHGHEDLRVHDETASLFKWVLDHAGELADALAAKDREIAELRAALESCVRALTASTIGTVNMDDPDWYQQVDLAVAAAIRSLGKEGSGE